MKYIDADRLKAEVKRIKNDYNRDSFVSGLAYLGKEEAIDEFCSLIDFLQQEQPEVFDTVVFQKGVQEGRRLEREDALTIAEAAKDFTVALVSSGSGLNPKTIAYAIEMADELIKPIKEEKQ